MPSNKYKNREDFNKYIHNETVKYQRQYGFKMGTGELIYIDDYTKADGTKVSGYYRRRPYYASKNNSK